MGVDDTGVIKDEVLIDERMVSEDADAVALEALGYKQEFKREFSLWSCFCLSFALLGLLPSIASTQYYGMGYAGTGGMTWGYIIGLTGVISVALSIAEVCSSMPTSGGLYYAAAVLAPQPIAPLCSWICGWSNWLAQITSAPSILYGGAQIILDTKVFVNPDYMWENYQMFLLSMGLLWLCAVLSALRTKQLSLLNTAGTTMNMLGLLICFIIMLAGSEKVERSEGQVSKFNSNKFVWQSIQNQTHFPDGIAILMSFLSVLWTMSGYDSAIHISEECSNAATAAPISIIMTACIGGFFGWILNIAMAYTVVDVPAAINDGDSAFVDYLAQCLSKNKVLAVSSLTIVSAVFMGQAGSVTASRVCYAYSRDNCLPFSSWLSKVNVYTQTPVNAIIYNTLIGTLLLLLIFAGETAIGAIFSVGAIGAYVSFTLPILCKVLYSERRFKKGPFHLGKLSWWNNVYSCAYTALMVPIMCLPQYTLGEHADGNTLSPDNMNWTVVVYGGPMLIALIWYAVYAHKIFSGPAVDPALLHEYGGPYTETLDEIHKVKSSEPKSSDEEKEPAVLIESSESN